MKVRPYHPELKQQWDQFCASQNSAWFWHTTFWMEYNLNCRFDVQTKNFSYLLVDDSEQTILAIVPLIKETSDGVSEWTFGGGSTPAPIIRRDLGERKQKEVRQFIFNEYHKLANHEQIQRIILRAANSSMTGNPFPADTTYLRYGFTEWSSYTSVLSLQTDERLLYKQMSTNHQRAIRKALASNVNVTLYDQTNIAESVFDSFVKVYFQSAGKVTRPQATFEKWYQLIRAGNGLLCELRYSGNPIGYVYVVVYKNYAYYAMGCNLNSKWIGAHFIHWELIKHLKARQIHYYELGEQFFSANLHDDVDDKNLMISKFKRQFGGSLVPQPAAEFFYSENYLRNRWNDRMEHYLQNRALHGSDFKVNPL